MKSKDYIAALLALVFKEERDRLPIPYERKNSLMKMIRSTFFNRSK